MLNILSVGQPVRSGLARPVRYESFWRQRNSLCSNNGDAQIHRRQTGSDSSSYLLHDKNHHLLCASFRPLCSEIISTESARGTELLPFQVLSVRCFVYCFLCCLLLNLWSLDKDLTIGMESIVLQQNLAKSNLSREYLAVWKFTTLLINCCIRPPPVAFSSQ
jgi:hypothetical protein